MAKFLPGPTVSAISGSIGGTVYSRNRGGMYMRNRSIPIVSTTAPALAAKARLGAQSAAWQGLSQAQRDNWKHWAEQNPVIDRLGSQRLLTGHQAFIKLNTRIDLIGETPLTEPPILPAPDALVTLTATVDTGAGNIELAFTVTPTPAGVGLYCWADLVDSPGINYVQNTLRFFHVSGAAQASPEDIKTDFEAVFGDPVVGQTAHFHVSSIRLADGQISPPIKDRVLVTTT